MLRHLYFLLLILVSFSSVGETIYKTTDDQGNIYFSDKPTAVEGNVEIIKRDQNRIHQRHDEDGSPLFENFTRNRGIVDAEGNITTTEQNEGRSQPVDRNGASPGSNKPSFKVAEIIKGSLATLLGAFLPFIGMLIIAIGLPLVLKSVLSHLKGRIGEEAVEKLLDSQGYEALHDVIIEDMSGEPTQIDHMLKLNSGLLVLETKNYGGMIFGRENEPTWTQRIGRRSYRFQNPLRQNYKHVETIRQYIPSLPIHSRVVFVGDAEFPKGRTANVLSLKDMTQELDVLQLTKINQERLDSAWNQVRALAKTDRATRQKHLQRLKKQHGHKPQLAIGVVLIAIGSFVLLFF